MPTKIKDNTYAVGKDLFQTPHYATRLLLPFLKPYTLVWEPASGYGRMSEVLEEQHAIWTSDVAGTPMEKFDFLEWEKPEEWMRQVDYIVTNPPYSKKFKFYDKCLYYWKRYGIPFALLVPTDYCQKWIKAVYEDMCQKIIPTRRIDYISPTGLHGKESSAKFHSMWLTKGLQIERPKPILPSEIYVPLSLKSKKEDIL